MAERPYHFIEGMEEMLARFQHNVADGDVLPAVFSEAQEGPSLETALRSTATATLDDIMTAMMQCGADPELQQRIGDLTNRVLGALVPPATLEKISAVQRAAAAVATARGEAIVRLASIDDRATAEEEIQRLWGQIDEFERDNERRMRHLLATGQITQTQFDEWWRQQQYADSLPNDDPNKDAATRAAAQTATDFARGTTEEEPVANNQGQINESLDRIRAERARQAALLREGQESEQPEVTTAPTEVSPEELGDVERSDVQTTQPEPEVERGRG